MIQPSFLSSPGGAAVFDTTLIERSAWFDGAADYMARQNGSAFINTKEAIFSFWIRRCKFSTQQAFFGSVEGGNGFILQFTSADKLEVYAAGATKKVSTQVFRDIAYYHIIVSFDTSQATATDRIKVWVNGEQITSWTTDTAMTLNGDIGGLVGAQTGAETMHIGNYNNTASNFYFWNGYIAQACMLESVSIQQGDYAVSDFLDTYTFGANGFQYVPRADAAVAALATAAGGNSFCLTTAIGDGTDASGLPQFTSFDTPGGNMTGGGGVAAAFDGNRNQSSGQGAYTASGTTGYVQVENCNGAALTMCRAWRPNETGYDGAAGGGTITFTIETSATGAWAGEETQLGTDTAIDYDGARSSYAYKDITLSGTVLEFVRLVISTSASGGVRLCECEFFTGTGKVPNTFTPTSMSDAANGTADTPSLVYPEVSFIDNEGYVAGGGNFFEGNKGWQGTSAGYSGPISTQWLNPASETGGFYVEAKLYNATNINVNTVGLLNESFDRNPNQYLGSTAGSWGIDGYARFYAEAISIFDSTNLTTASVVQFYFEPSEGKLWIGIDDSYWNGSSLTTFSAASPSVSGLPTDQLYAFGIRGGNSGGWYMYFEEQDWTYSPPASGVPINSANLGTPSFQGADYFTVTLAQEADIEADVASAVADWSSNVTLYKNLAAAESWIHRFSSDASNEYLTGDNTSPTYQPTSTLAGTNAWVAFSFRTEGQAYQQTGISHTNGAVTTVTHNLGNADAMILLYNRSGTGNIFIYAPQLTAGKLVTLNTNAPEAVDTSIQNVLANSFDIGSTQATGTYDVFILLNGDVFGVTSYIGNGATDGAFLPLSFKPQFTYIRHINVTNDGPFFDTTRDDTGNVTNDALFINLNDVEYPDISSYNQDFLSGGWKARTTNVSFNASSVKYFVLAIADIAGGGDLPPIYGR